MLASLLRASHFLLLAAPLALVACESVPDVRFTDDGGGSPTVDSSAPFDANGPTDAGATDGDASNACLPPNAPTTASCCFGTYACAGQGCGHCPECQAQACKPNEYCCAHLNPQGTFVGEICSPTPATCP